MFVPGDYGFPWPSFLMDSINCLTCGLSSTISGSMKLVMDGEAGAGEFAARREMASERSEAATPNFRIKLTSRRTVSPNIVAAEVTRLKLFPPQPLNSRPSWASPPDALLHLSGLRIRIRCRGRRCQPRQSIELPLQFLLGKHTHDGVYDFALLEEE